MGKLEGRLRTFYSPSYEVEDLDSGWEMGLGYNLTGVGLWCQDRAKGRPEEVSWEEEKQKTTEEGLNKVCDQMNFSSTGSIHRDGTMRPLISGGKKEASSEVRRGG